MLICTLKRCSFFGAKSVGFFIKRFRENIIYKNNQKNQNDEVSERYYSVISQKQ